MPRSLMMLVVVFVGWNPAIAAEASNKSLVTTEIADAGADFAVQGEYLGESKSQETYGAQVVALSEGKFDLVLFTGGLPGEGWKRGDKREKSSGETKDGVTVFTAKDWIGTLKEGALTLSDNSGNGIATLKKTERKSPTLGAKPPEGAKVLFDGKSADAFKNGRLTKDGLLMVGT